MKANADNKCHLVVNSDESYTAKIEDFNIKISTKEKLLLGMSPLFVKRQARNYTLLQEYHITWT